MKMHKHVYSTTDDRAAVALRHIVSLTMLLACWAGFAYAQEGYDRLAAHSQGNIQLTVHPGGWGHIVRAHGANLPYIDPITNDSIYGCEYPRGSRNIFPDGILHIAGVSGSDTLELLEPHWINELVWDRQWRKRSTDKSQPHYSSEAKSDLDLECRFYDTAVYDEDLSYRVRWHEPLGLKLIQRSMAWTGGMVDDFVLFDYEIYNIGESPLTELYVGFWCSGVLSSFDFVPDAGNLTGFLDSYPASGRCDFLDTLNIAYTMDNDGDPLDGRFTPQSRRGAVGVMLLGSTTENLRLGYYWYVWDPPWTEDWGPRRRPTNEEPWRSFNPRFAALWTMQNRYYILTHPHIAYDQLFAAVDHTAEGWLPPGGMAEVAATGWPAAMLYSFGPFDIGVNEHINFTVAVVGGDHVHNDPTLTLNPELPQ